MKDWTEVFEKADVNELNENAFKLIGKEWFLITAGDKDNFNTMTASWGTMGVLWNKPVAMCFIRPSRHTFNFSESEDFFTLSFLQEGNRDILNVCGSKSGRDFDKVKETGLVPVQLEGESVTFEQARLVLECKKVYYDDIKPVFLLPDKMDETFYSEHDYHRMYIGEVLNAYTSKK